MIGMRRARPEDAEVLTAIMRASRAYGGEYYIMVKRYAVSADMIEHEEVWVAEDNGEIVGFYCLVDGPRPELDLMFTVDDAQGRGIGKALFEHMKQRARARRFPSVRIVSHPPSVGFYKRMGARLIGNVPSMGHVTWSRPELELIVPQEATAE
jgi:GNAT superfamily N-acetyltransferase